jgi:hypothetical protein
MALAVSRAIQTGNAARSRALGFDTNKKVDGMTEATWGDDIKTPGIDWRMSASLENVPRGDSDLAEVTSLEGAVRAWLDLNPEHKAVAVLTPERAVLIDGVSSESLAGDSIAALAEHLPGTAAGAA